jgi:hypothetical protein
LADLINAGVEFLVPFGLVSMSHIRVSSLGLLD